MPTNVVQNGVVWDTISSITLWVLWTNRCQRIFQQIVWNVVDVVEIWVTLVHTLKGQYDAIKGDSNVVFRNQEDFKKRCERMEVFCMVNVIYVGGINNHSEYFLHRHEACGRV